MCGARASISRAGLPRSIIQKTAPREYVQHARNPARNVTIGGKDTVFAPVYGPPFIRNLDEGRRYATIEDFRNFVKLAYMSPAIHHSGGTVCEPVDLPVNKRHLDMVYSHIRYSDKPFMGSVTHPERAAGHGRPGEDRLRRRVRQTEHGHHQPDQRQFADGLGRHHAGRAQGLCAQQPGLHRHALHPVGRHEPGDGGGHAGAGAGRGAVGRRHDPADARRARRCCSACSPAPCPCSRGRRPSGRRSRRWCRSPPGSWRGGSAFPSAPAARSAAPRSRTPRRPMRARRRCCRRCSPAPTSCCMRRAGSRAAWRRAMRSSSWMPTSSA